MSGMNNDFDKNFTDKFKEEFDNFKVPYNVENWNRLEQRLKFIRKRKVLKYYTGIAASFGFLIIIFILLNIYPQLDTITGIRRNIGNRDQKTMQISKSAADSVNRSRQRMVRYSEKASVNNDHI